MAKIPFYIKLETEDLVSVYLITSLHMYTIMDYDLFFFVYKASEGWV